MKTLKQKIVLGVLGGMMMLSALAATNAFSGTGPEKNVTSKVNEYEGQHRVVASVHTYVNEYEGQH
jgi:hypothetical protein